MQPNLPVGNKITYVTLVDW